MSKWEELKNLAKIIYENSEYGVRIKPSYEVVTDRIILTIYHNWGDYMEGFNSEEDALNFIKNEYKKWIK